MLSAHTLDRLRNELRGVILTIGLVALLTLGVFAAVQASGLGHGSVVYLLPVLIAAIRWGIVSAIVAAVCGVLASAFFFYPPLYSLRITDPQEVVNLFLFIVVAVVVSQLATRLRRQLELAQRREVDMRDLYAFSRRLAGAFGLADIHAAIEDHLASVLQSNVILFAGGRDGGSGRRPGAPQPVLDAVAKVAAGGGAPSDAAVRAGSGEIWLVHAVSPKNAEFGVVAINLGRKSQDEVDELRVRLDAVLADAAATLERLDVAHAIGEARMRAQTEQLREALIESVSHELRTPLASILGAATVLSAAPALQNEKKLKALVHDVRDEAERLNNDIQNLLDATRISSDGVTPRAEWAEPADIVNSALERCRARLAERRLERRPGARPAAGARRSGAGAAGLGADDRQRGEIFARRLAHHGLGARGQQPSVDQRQRRRRRPHQSRTGEDVGPLRARRTPRRADRRLRPRAVDRQCLCRGQRRQHERRQPGTRPRNDHHHRTAGDASRRPAHGRR